MPNIAANLVQSQEIRAPLQRINEDKAKFSLLPVKLSQNDAAQVHAKDILKIEQKYHTR